MRLSQEARTALERAEGGRGASGLTSEDVASRHAIVRYPLPLRTLP